MTVPGQGVGSTAIFTLFCHKKVQINTILIVAFLDRRPTPFLIKGQQQHCFKGKDRPGIFLMDPSEREETNEYELMVVLMGTDEKVDIELEK